MTKENLAQQVDLFREVLDEGISIEEAIEILAIGSMLNFEFSQDSIGDLLGIPKAESD